MLRRTLATLVAGAALLGATAAQAGTHWSIGINLPPADFVVSNGPRYYAEPAPVYYAPAPVVRYVPAPRYVEREVYYAPTPRVVYERSYRDRRWDGRWDDRDGRWDAHRDRDHDRREHSDRRDRDDYGPRRGR
ncbi:MAG: hypothetical protein EOP35_22170 [Rubrivivax sp.]|nr:MAG: hypothetical protein EOP35_22170 [Rubrivivax sp.]